MKYLDGKKNLKRTFLNQLMKSEEDKAMFSYVNTDGEDVAEEYDKLKLFENVFTEEKQNEIKDESIVLLATDSVIVEAYKEDMHWWMKPIHVPKLYAIIDKEVEKPTKAAKKKVVVREKFIAISEYDAVNESYEDVESIKVSSRKQKPALNWLNEHIQQFTVRKKYDKLRVCVDYSETEPNEWFSVDELLESGVASI